MPRQCLNDRQRRFCELLAGGLSQAEAYRQAGYATSEPHKLAPRLASKPEVAAYLAQLREDSKSAMVLEIAEKRQYLARVIRTPIGEVDADSDLAQEKTVRFEGENGSVEKVKMPSKLETLRLDSQLAGHIDSRSNVTVNNTVVPQIVERSEAEIESFLERKARILERMGLAQN